MNVRDKLGIKYRDPVPAQNWGRKGEYSHAKRSFQGSPGLPEENQALIASSFLFLTRVCKSSIMFPDVPASLKPLSLSLFRVEKRWTDDRPSFHRSPQTEINLGGLLDTCLTKHRVRREARRDKRTMTGRHLYAVNVAGENTRGWRGWRGSSAV